jgi:hypothetical protein
MPDFAAAERQSQCRGGTLFGCPLLTIAVAAFAVVVPLFFLGIPSGHDFEFHINSWMEILGQWRQGIIYPRWAALAHYRYGEARFIFYPPISWFLGTALGAVLPWKMVPGAYVWLALTLSGCSMFVLARRWLSRNDAVFAAAVYAANPYYIVIVYWRSAFAELLAGALLPLLVLGVANLAEQGRKAVVPLALIAAAAVLTNVPASIVVNYSLALLALTFAIPRRSPKILLYAAAAGGLGASLAAFFILPALCEQKWINIAQLLSPGLRPQDNFLFTNTADLDHNRFNLLVSLVASAMLVVLVIATFLVLKQRREQPHIWSTLVTWAGPSALLMFSFSAVLWAHLPLLRFVQLPWRWLLCLNVTLAVLMTIAWKPWLWRVTAFLVMLAAVVFAWHRIQPPWWEGTADIQGLLSQHQSGAGYEGTDEYAPAGADPYDVKRDAPLVALENGALLRVQVQKWGPEKKLFVVETSWPGKLVLRLFNYPAWRVEVNGHKVESETKDDTGQMLIPVAPGESRVQITFIRTWDRTVGGVVSLVSAAVLLLWLVKGRWAGAPI